MPPPWTPEGLYDQAYIEEDYIDDYFEFDEDVEQQSDVTNTWTPEAPA